MLNWAILLNFLIYSNQTFRLFWRRRGCIEYYPAVDVQTGLPPQELDENVVTVIEKWENLDALKNHLGTPHMLAYREQVKEIVEKLTVKVLKEAWPGRLEGNYLAFRTGSARG